VEIFFNLPIVFAFFVARRQELLQQVCFPNFLSMLMDDTKDMDASVSRNGISINKLNSKGEEHPRRKESPSKSKSPVKQTNESAENGHSGWQDERMETDRQDRRRDDPAAANQGNTLYVTGMNSGVTEAGLREIFSPFGEVSCFLLI
jgi:RNA recognition motif-containing protein